MTLGPRSPLSPPSDTGREIARQLLDSQLRDEMDDSARVAEAVRQSVCVSEGLSRLFGPYGALALVTRALTAARANHIALADVSVITDAATRVAVLAGIERTARLHGAKAATEGFVGWAAALYDLLGRLIGDDLASRLIRNCVAREDHQPEPHVQTSASHGPPPHQTAVDAALSGADVLPTVNEQ
jgi:hypothetical protein